MSRHVADVVDQRWNAVSLNNTKPVTCESSATVCLLSLLSIILPSSLVVSEHPVHHSQQIVDVLREAKEMTKFDHPRIVKLLSVCTV